MPKKPTYIALPIYSVTAFRNFIYFSGGGGGKTGIPNQIFVFQGKVTPEPLKRIDTGRKIVENMTTNGQDEILVCSANQNILVFKIEEKGKSLSQIHEFEGDFSFKNPTINCIYMLPTSKIFLTGGDDKKFRAYSLQIEQDKITTPLIWSHEEHQNPLRTIDGAKSSFYASTDQQKIVIVDLNKKEIIRKIYSDVLNPIGSAFQSAYFDTFSYLNNLKTQVPALIMCHYIPRSSAFITRQLPTKMLETIKISADQSCLTARNHRYIGLASGNGTTYIFDPQQFKCVGVAKGHQFVITAATMTRGLKFITGTPQCSYYIQQAEQNIIDHHILAIILTIIIILIIGMSSTQLQSIGQL